MWVPYLASALLAGAVGFAEILSRFPDAPWRVVRDPPALSYIGINACAGASAFWLIDTFSWTFGSNFPAEATQVFQVLVAGVGALTFLRSAFFQVRVGDTDVNVGPSGLLSAILTAAHRSMDRRRAVQRDKVVADIMSRIDFDNAKAALPNHCFKLMQNVSPLEEVKVGEEVKACDNLMTMPNVAKSKHLGLILMNIVGEKVLRQAVDSLGDEIRTDNP